MARSKSGELDADRIFTQFMISQEKFIESVDKLSKSVEDLSDKFDNLKEEVKGCKSCMVKRFSLYFGITLGVVLIIALGREYAPVLLKLFKTVSLII